MLIIVMKYLFSALKLFFDDGFITSKTQARISPKKIPKFNQS